MNLQELKIIDFEKKGHLVRLYLGDKNLNEYYGDDWNDVPYDCNAGTVYDRFATGFIDVVFQFDSYVLEPSNEWISSGNCGYCKDDMKNRNMPCIVYVPYELDDGYFYDNFSRWVGSDNATKIYFEDTINVNERREVFCNNNKIQGVNMILMGSFPKEDN